MSTLTPETYRRIVEALQEGIWLVDEHHVTTFVNRPMADMLGYAPEEMEGQPLFAFMDERGVENTRRNLARRQQGIAEQHDFELIHRDGHRIYTTTEGAPILDEHGVYRGAIAGVIDITKRRLAEDSLRASEARFRVLFEAAGVGICLMTPDRVIEALNDAGHAMLGYAPGELLGRFMGDLGHPDDNQVTVETRESLLSGLAWARFEKRYVRKDGGVVHVLVTATAVRDDEGRVTQLVGVMQDLTDLKRAEAELVRTQKLESLGVLAGGIAHDFNNLLTAMLANVSMALERAGGDAVQAQLLRDAENAALQASSLTRQLLAFSRGGEPVRAPVDLGRLIRETVRFRLTGSDVACEPDLAADLACVLADEGQLGQVIGNLVLNAAQAQPRDGRIRVAATNEAEWIALRVSDTGHGIRPEDLDRVFDPYFTTRPSGSGLGLAVTHSIVQRHGGRIRVASELGQGTTFTVLLPAHAGPAPAASERPDDARRVRARVLVMDDEPAVRNVARLALERAGCEVIEAAHGAEAEQRYLQSLDEGSRIDLLIVDLTVPGAMGGLELLRRLRGVDPRVRAIVSSGYSSDPIMARYEEHGFAGVLPKPWRPRQLVDAVREVLVDEHG